LPIRDRQDHLSIATQSSFGNRISQCDDAAPPDQITNLIRLYEFLKNTFSKLRSDTKTIVQIAWVSNQTSLVEDDGIEPTTPCLQSRCSPS
jgi:hypothetical protein